MTTTHTQGRLHVKGAQLRDDGPGIDCIATMQVSNQPFWDQDARRLAACWNAFVGATTEAIEELGPIAGVMCDPAQTRIFELEAERDTLLQLLHRVTQDPGWTRMDPPLKADIAKALGMPETPMFPDEAAAFAKASADIAHGSRQSNGKLPG